MILEKIFIVDDSEMDTMLIKGLLQSIGINSDITTFENPVAAYNFLKTEIERLPDLIFLDLNMPQLHGFQFLERVSQLPQQVIEHCKFIIVTSSDCPEDIKHSSIYPNVIKYFIKPVNKIDLLEFFHEIGR